MDTHEPSAGFARNPTKSVKEFLTTDFADFTDKHTLTRARGRQS